MIDGDYDTKALTKRVDGRIGDMACRSAISILHQDQILHECQDTNNSMLQSSPFSFHPTTIFLIMRENQMRRGWPVSLNLIEI
jgi:hypothetical protein